METAALIISVLALVASGISALYTRSQAVASSESAKIAKQMLLHETEAQLKFRLQLRFTLPDDERGEGSSTDSVWFLENNGKADALGVGITFEFDPSGIQYGRFFFDRVPAGAAVRLEPKTALPGIVELWLPKEQRTQRADLTWSAPNGGRRSKTIDTIT